MLVFSRKIHDLRHFGFCNLMAKDPDDSQPFLMYGKHNFKGLWMVHTEKTFQHDNHKFHGRVIVVQQENFVKWRPFGFRTRFYNEVQWWIIFVWWHMIWYQWHYCRDAQLHSVVEVYITCRSDENPPIHVIIAAIAKNPIPQVNLKKIMTCKPLRHLSQKKLTPNQWLI